MAKVVFLWHFLHLARSLASTPLQKRLQDHGNLHLALVQTGSQSTASAVNCSPCARITNWSQSTQKRGTLQQSAMRPQTPGISISKTTCSFLPMPLELSPFFTATHLANTRCSKEYLRSLEPEP